MRLTVVFESWHIDDRNYPPLSVGDLVRLSFEVEDRGLAPAMEDALRFDVRDDGACDFVADVIRHYARPKWEPIAVLDAGTFRFYICGRTVTSLSTGQRVRGEGVLLLDHYSWVEFLDEYSDPPDLFYNFKVSRIRKIQIPERFIRRHRRRKAWPASLPSSEYSAADVEELHTMIGQDFDEEFYLLDLDSSGLENESIPRTFLL